MIREAYRHREKAPDLVVLVDAAHAHIARVELVFGPTSHPVEHARLAVGALREGTDIVIVGTAPERDVRSKIDAADDHLRRFSAHAHAAMRKAKYAEPPTHA